MSYNVFNKIHFICFNFSQKSLAKKFKKTVDLFRTLDFLKLCGITFLVTYTSIILVHILLLDGLIKMIFENKYILYCYV